MPFDNLPPAAKEYLLKIGSTWHCREVNHEYNPHEDRTASDEFCAIDLPAMFKFLQKGETKIVEVIHGEDPAFSWVHFSLVVVDNVYRHYFLLRGFFPETLMHEGMFFTCYNPRILRKNVPTPMSIEHCVLKACVVCGANEHLKPCGPCKDVNNDRFYYCSKACQTQDWRAFHKAFCASVKK